MYVGKFICVVKCGGHILREHDNSEGGVKDCVTLPYNSEYSLLLKNLESRKASVKIFIDGQDVLFGNTLVIEPNSETEIDRFLDSMDSGNRFKFLKKTQQMVEHRGDKIDDGMVRVEFTYEKRVEQVKSVITTTHHHRHQYDWPWHYVPTGPFLKGVGEVSFADNSQSIIGGSDVTCNYMSNTSIGSSGADSVLSNAVMDSMDISNDEGITGRGSVSDKQFHHSWIGELEDQGHSLVLRLKGTSEKGVKVAKAVTTKSKLQCSACGAKSKSSASFCPACGNALSVNQVV